MTGEPSETSLAAARLAGPVLVPADPEAWPGRTLETAVVGPGDAVLDVACGIGSLARYAAVAVGPDGFVAGLDPDENRLAVAAELSPELTWHLGRADAIPYADGRFDAVVCLFGLMFFDDPVRSLREMMRVLRPGGRLAVAVWDTLANTPAYDALAGVVDRAAGRWAGDLVRAPFVLGDVDELLALFAAAGLPGATVRSYGDIADQGSVRAMVEAELLSWPRSAALDEETFDRIFVAAEVALREFVLPGGGLRLASPGHVAVATR